MDRRTLLQGLVAMPTASCVMTTPASAATPDAELIALCARLDELEHAYCATGFNFDDDSPEGRAAEAERDIIQAQQDALVLRIDATPAQTLAGVQAVARSLVLWGPRCMTNGAHDNGEVLLNVILQDLLKLDGRDA